jgi:hypothetical protein
MVCRRVALVAAGGERFVGGGERRFVIGLDRAFEFGKLRCGKGRDQVRDRLVLVGRYRGRGFPILA